MLTEIRYETPIESIAGIEGDVIFLAGPTVRGHQPHLTSWRFAAIEELKRQGFDGTVIIPEFVSKTESDKHRTDLPLWEFAGLKRANVITFWIPRTRDFVLNDSKIITGLIALTTNWEHGYWVARCPEKLVYGRPDDAYRMSYLDIMWEAALRDRHSYPAATTFFAPPILRTLEGTVAASIALVNELKK